MNFLNTGKLEVLDQELWFKSEYFPIFYSEKDKQEVVAFVKKIGNALNFKNGERGIDLCCGTGRFSVELTNLGLEILGIDLSGFQIQQAHALANATLKFQVDNIETYRASEEFDYAFNFFSSFGYKNETTNLKILNNIHQMLKPNGKLILDYWNSSNQKYMDRLNTGQERISERTIGKTTFTTRSIVSKDYYLKEIFLNDNGIKRTFKERIMALDIDMFQSYFMKCNFEIAEVYGDYDLAPYNKLLSDRIIFFVNRK